MGQRLVVTYVTANPQLIPIRAETAVTLILRVLLTESMVLAGDVFLDVGIAASQLSQSLML